MRASFILSLLLALLLLGACQEKRPDYVMDRRKMESVLYDYHLAQALANQRSDSAAYYNNLYTESVFLKHKISEAVFDSSMLWYMSNTEELYKIYDRLDERLAGDAKNHRATLDGAGADMNNDTLNIWEGRSAYLLSTSLGAGKMSFAQEADSSFREGDLLTWSFKTKWMYREGSKRAIALLALVYDNDSVATVSHSIYRTGVETLNIKVAKRPVKEIRGFVYQSTTWSEKPKLLSLSEVELCKVSKKQLLQDSVKPAAKPSPSVRDTLEHGSGKAEQAQ